MAKIKFGDYLKSKQKKETVYESEDAIAKRAEALIRTDSCTVQPHFRLKNLNKALELLEQIPDHPDTAVLMTECRDEMEKAKKLIVQADFENAKYHLKSASTEHEFRKASEELAAIISELKAHPDAVENSKEMLQETEQMKGQADAQIVRYSAKTTRHRWIALIALIAIAAAALYGWLSGYALYMAAKLEGLGGIYQSAYSRFYKLGDYLDSRSQYEYYKEKYLRQREHEESQSLPEAEIGDTVRFSDFSWLVIGKDDTKLTLICEDPDKGSAFYNVTYDGAQKELREEMSIAPETDEMSDSAAAETEKSSAESAVESAAETIADDTTESSAGSASWESSSLRTYLNETVLEHEFTPAEIAAMEPQTTEPTVNQEYGTKLDESSEDLITILSTEMAAACRKDKVFRKPGVDMWLRTPGHDMASAAYVTAKGNVMLYGNDVTDDSLSVCPLIIVDYTKLES